MCLSVVSPDTVAGMLSILIYRPIFLFPPKTSKNVAPLLRRLPVRWHVGLRKSLIYFLVRFPKNEAHNVHRLKPQEVLLSKRPESLVV